MKKKIIRIVTVPQSFGLIKGQMKGFSKDFNFIGISSKGEQVDQVEKYENIKVKTINLTRRITPFQDLIAIFKLYFFLRKEKPYIVHSHTPKAGLVGMIASKFAGVKHRIHTVAGMPLMEASGFKRRVLDFVEMLTYSCATKVLPNSNNLKNFIVDNKYTNDSKVSVIGNGSTNGIDLHHFSIKRIEKSDLNNLRLQFNIDKNDFVFLFVGRIVKDKGIVELVESFKKIKSVNENSKLLLVGGFERELDPLPLNIEKEIETNSDIIFCGFQNDVRSFFAIADLFVFPSYREGFPNVVLQAGAMEVPSVVTDINGSNEIIEDTHNGLIVLVKNSNDLFEKIKYLLDNKSILLKMKKNCRKNIAGKYDQKLVWNQLLKMYRNL